MRYRQLLSGFGKNKSHLKFFSINLEGNKLKDYDSREIVNLIFENNIEKATDLLLLKYQYYPSFQKKLKLMFESKITPHAAFSHQPQEFQFYEDKIIQSYFLISYPDYAHSETCLNEAIKMCPMRAEAYIFRGHLYTALNEYLKAELDYNQALKLSPAWQIQIYLSKGKLLEKQNRFDEAISLYDQLLKDHPDHLTIYLDKAGCLGFKKEYKLAIEECDKALKINKLNPYIYYNKGLFLYLMGNLKEAIENFDEAIKLNPYDHNFHYHKGNVLADSQNYESAIVNYKGALELQPDHYPSEHNLRIILKKLPNGELINNPSSLFCQKHHSKVPTPRSEKSDKNSNSDNSSALRISKL